MSNGLSLNCYTILCQVRSARNPILEGRWHLKIVRNYFESAKCLKKLASSLEIPPSEETLKNGTLGRELKSHIAHLTLARVHSFLQQNPVHPGSGAPCRTGCLHGNHIAVGQFCPLPHPVCLLSCLSMPRLQPDFCSESVHRSPFERHLLAIKPKPQGPV